MLVLQNQDNPGGEGKLLSGAGSLQEQQEKLKLTQSLDCNSRVYRSPGVGEKAHGQMVQIHFEISTHRLVLPELPARD